LAATSLGLAAQTQALSLEPHAGYTTVNMSDLNKGNDALYGWYATGSAEHVHDGLVAGLDLIIPVSDSLDFGVRGEWLQTNQTQDIYWNGGTTFGWADQGTLSSALLGLRGRTPFIAKGLELGLGAWAGYGYATMKQDNISGDVQDGLFMGSLWVAELEGSLHYSVSKRISVGFTGGWRWANAGALYDDTHKPLVEAGQYWENSLYFPVSVDFSGISAQGSVSYSF
jgi:hypothetical protein